MIEFEVWHPRNPKHGDYTTDIAFKLAEMTGGDPMVIAKIIVAELNKLSGKWVNFD